MKIGDLVTDEWGYLAIITSQVGSHAVSNLGLRWRIKYIAIITSQVGVTDRWRIKYIRCGGVSTSWASNLHPLK